jgi:hypothetical protein
VAAAEIDNDLRGFERAAYYALTKRSQAMLEYRNQVVIRLMPRPIPEIRSGSY